MSEAQTDPWTEALDAAARLDAAYREAGRSTADQMFAKGPAVVERCLPEDIAAHVAERLIADAKTVQFRRYMTNKIREAYLARLAELQAQPIGAKHGD